MDPIALMRSRRRRHLVICLGACGVAFIGVIAGIVLLQHVTEAGSKPPPWVSVLIFVPIVGVAAVGVWSTLANLRCPSCRGIVARQVSASSSMFRLSANKKCRHCGTQIFPS